MKILALDTSNQALAVALLSGDQLLAETILNIKKNHSVSLMPVIDFLMDQVSWQPKDLERIVVAQGPGSYTGLRMAVATAKVLASSLKIDLVGVSSLQALLPGELEGLVVPLIDARRNHVYTGIYEKGKSLLADGHRDFTALLEHLVAEKATPITFVGEVSAFRDQILAVLSEASIRPSLPSAYRLGLLGKDLPAQEIASFEPAYLKRVEAEENWLKTNAEGEVDTYIKRV